MHTEVRSYTAIRPFTTDPKDYAATLHIDRFVLKGGKSSVPNEPLSVNISGAWLWVFGAKLMAERGLDKMPDDFDSVAGGIYLEALRGQYGESIPNIIDVEYRISKNGKRIG